MVTVASWNVENLFCPGTEAGPTSQSAYREKLDALAGTVSHLDPDLLAVQEVGDPDAVSDLLAAFGGRWHSELADPDGRGIRVGIFSRRRLHDVEQITAFPDKLAPVQVDDDGSTLADMGRPALRVRVELGDTSVDVVSCHLKSKLLTFPGGRFNARDEHERARYTTYALHRRAAEAAAVRAYVTRLFDDNGQNLAVIVAGDLNDEPEAATTQLLHGPPGSEIGTDGFERPDKGDAQRLWNLGPLIPEAQRFSRIYRGRGELIDHLLVSHVLVGAVSSVGTGDTGIVSVTDDPEQRRDETGSDHRPVVARFDLP
ncbi:endonuclease/exonuclease/phosphatase family protein [Actinopolymorpha pittospori]|uniref:Endonuclease/exonuclease/phosphatase family metal-dependent hydrolase n=1 Tax=Actinopolymorpha pittospori TaxID=648752 RepID=A0A927R900_9ACTN|nr:endonuclease/exonuclease/phosphatase family metal-dependent hydrolase [Actinopolymorpha pittospori]